MTARSIRWVNIVTNTEMQVINNGQQWTDIPGASVTLAVPAGWKQALIITRFVSQGLLEGCAGLGTCQVRTTIDGTVITPGGSAHWIDTDEPQAMEGSLTVDSGTHVIQVQILPAMSQAMDINEWILTTEVARVS